LTVPGTEEFRYWIKHNIYPPDDVAALREADNHDYGPLIAFARS